MCRVICATSDAERVEIFAIQEAPVRGSIESKTAPISPAPPRASNYLLYNSSGNQRVPDNSNPSVLRPPPSSVPLVAATSLEPNLPLSSVLMLLNLLLLCLQKRRFDRPPITSGPPPTPDICSAPQYVSNVPTTEVKQA
jgi:hypothetical protein